MRWNRDRFQSIEFIQSELNREGEDEIPSTQSGHLNNCDNGATNENSAEIYENPIINHEEVIYSTSTTSKRKATTQKGLHEYKSRTQPKRIKKNN